MNQEQKIQKEIQGLYKKNPNYKTIDVAKRFNKSYFWAYSRTNPRYMTKKVRDMVLASIKEKVKP